MSIHLFRRVNVFKESLTTSAVLLAASAVLVSAASPAWSQVGGVVDRTLSNQNELLRRVKPVPKQGQIDITVIDERELVPLEQAEKITFVLRSLSISGAETVPEQDLQAAWRDKLGTTISLADLYRIADEIEAIYRRAGYFSQAVVPQQNFYSGEITLNVYETGFDEITIESDIPDIQSRLAPYIDRLLALQPVPVAEVERILLLMSDLGGLDIEGLATRPQRPGEGGRMHLKVDRTPVTGRVGLDNFGSKEVGRLELTASLDLNDQLGLFETTSIAGVTVPNDPQELRLVQFSQDYPVGTYGLHAGYNIAYVASRPGGNLRSFDIDARTVSGSLFARYPFIRRIQHSLFGTVDLNFENSDVHVGGVRSGRDRNRWATASLSYDRDLEQGYFTLKALAGTGLDAFGQQPASDPLSSRPGVPDHYRFGQLQASLQHALWKDASFSVQAIAQHSPDPLPPSLQLDLGGTTYGRAFDSATAKGDSGAAVLLELSQQFNANLPNISNTSAFAFVDFGEVHNRAVSVEYQRQSLGSAGAGLRAQLGSRVQGQVYVATPWKQERQYTESGTRVMFSISAAF